MDAVAAKVEARLGLEAVRLDGTVLKALDKRDEIGGEIGFKGLDSRAQMEEHRRGAQKEVIGLKERDQWLGAGVGLKMSSTSSSRQSTQMKAGWMGMPQQVADVQEMARQSRYRRSDREKAKVCGEGRSKYS